MRAPNRLVISLFIAVQVDSYFELVTNIEKNEYVSHIDYICTINHITKSTGIRLLQHRK